MLAHLRFIALLFTVLFSIHGLAQGTLETIRIHSPSLAGNLSGDDPEREVFVYLPPGYESSNKNYPVIYFLHGYAVGAQIYVEGVLNLPDSADAALAAGADEFILVMPDAFTRYGGSMYSNSPAIGDWESWIADDLVSYIDNHYRTLAQPESRGLSGHSMGGYGTLRIGMKKPGVFGALYAMSSCCLMNTASGQEAVEQQQARMAEGLEIQAGTFANAMQAQAAAWSANPNNPPYYFDLPYQNGEPNPLVQARWPANSPLAFAIQYVPALQSYRAIFLDVGDEDGLETTNTQLAGLLTDLGVSHEYEIYAGNHGNRVGQRFIDNVMPFFAEHLDPGMDPGQTFMDCALCPEMVVLPAGSFLMGSPPDEAERRDNEPQREVTFAEPFAMAATPITWNQWEACVRDNWCEAEAIEAALALNIDGTPRAEAWDFGRGTRPAVGMNWFDALRFVGWLNWKSGADDTYSLPSEAQWEYGARAGTTTRFPWGDELDYNYGNFGLRETGLGGQAEGRDVWVNETSPVASFPPNAFGLYDMHGNIFEWTADCYEPDFANAPVDGSASTEGDCSVRVFRSGTFLSNPYMQRSARRGAPYPATTRGRNYLGFRVVKSLD